VTAEPPILVIKLAALGDFAQAIGPFKAIRAHHLGTPLVLLTTAPYAELARTSGLFEDIWIDSRPGLLEIGAWLTLRRRLNAAGFARVYDLQTSNRTGFYFRLMQPKPEWSGIAGGCSHPHANPDRDHMHTIERQAEQLALAGIDHIPPADLNWVTADTDRFAITRPYAVLIPGGSAHRPAKRWPAERFAILAEGLAAGGLQPVVLGGGDEIALTQRVAGEAGLDLGGRTDLFDVVGLCRDAELVIGNDSGPLHLAAITGRPTVVLFSAASDPALCAPRGQAVRVIHRQRLDDLAVDEVLAAADLG
jgi:ADP-heptose:LPS heptosyltransferase|tara:strand:+ start:2451 stop:3368 length:918 start_codon:yes stop_codon:yes gene_type:complete